MDFGSFCLSAFLLFGMSFYLPPHTFGSYNIDVHDYTVRLKAAKKFLADGDKVAAILFMIQTNATEYCRTIYLSQMLKVQYHSCRSKS